MLASDQVDAQEVEDQVEVDEAAEGSGITNHLKKVMDAEFVLEDDMEVQNEMQHESKSDSEDYLDSGDSENEIE